MKKLALLAFAAATTMAFATPPSGPQIDISGISKQTVTATSSTFRNYSDANSFAVQNVSSNAGNVDVEGYSEQTTTASRNSMVSNRALGHDAYAAQNLASNTGKVNIDKGARSIQMVSLTNATVANTANSHSSAVQNLASNNGCSSCQPGEVGHKPKK